MWRAFVFVSLAIAIVGVALETMDDGDSFYPPFFLMYLGIAAIPIAASVACLVAEKWRTALFGVTGGGFLVAALRISPGMLLVAAALALAAYPVSGVLTSSRDVIRALGWVVVGIIAGAVDFFIVLALVFTA